MTKYDCIFRNYAVSPAVTTVGDVVWSHKLVGRCVRHVLCAGGYFLLQIKQCTMYYT